MHVKIGNATDRQIAIETEQIKVLQISIRRDCTGHTARHVDFNVVACNTNATRNIKHQRRRFNINKWIRIVRGTVGDRSSRTEGEGAEHFDLANLQAAWRGQGKATARQRLFDDQRAASLRNVRIAATLQQQNRTRRNIHTEVLGRCSDITTCDQADVITRHRRGCV